MYVERLGRGKPVVLLHGFGAYRFTWRYWAPELARTNTVYLVDFRGFGDAKHVRPPEYAPVDFARDVCHMLRALDLEGATLVGHSMGGGVALLATLMLQDAGEGDRIARLVSVVGTAYEQKIPYYVELLRHTPTQILLQVLPTGRLIRKVIESIVFDPSTVTDEQVEGYTRPLRSWSAKRAAVHCALQLIPDDLDEIVARYPEIEKPTLILWGRQDPVVPLSVGQRLARELPNSRLVVLDRCGHIVPEELAKESLQVVMDFLREG